MRLALKWFVRIWVGLVVALNLLGIAGMLLTAPSLWEGVTTVQEFYSPFHRWNWGLNMVLLLPAIGAYFLEKHLEARASRVSSSAQHDEPEDTV